MFKMLTKQHQKGKFRIPKPKGGGKPLHTGFAKTRICLFPLLLFLGFCWVSNSVLLGFKNYWAGFWKPKLQKHKAVKTQRRIQNTKRKKQTSLQNTDQSAKTRFQNTNQETKHKLDKMLNFKTQISLQNTKQQNANQETKHKVDPKTVRDTFWTNTGEGFE